MPYEQLMDKIKAMYEENEIGVIHGIQAFAPTLRAAENVKVVIVGGDFGSLMLVTDPNSIYSTAIVLAYNLTKTAVDAVMVTFAKVLALGFINVNVTDADNVSADLNGQQSTLMLNEGASVAIRLGTIGVVGLSGGFWA